jgi:hypothetical protein
MADGQEGLRAQEDIAIWLYMVFFVPYCKLS